jgi:hypothetical protein
MSERGEAGIPPEFSAFEARMKDAGEKAHILAEALPYIREFSGKTSC